MTNVRSPIKNEVNAVFVHVQDLKKSVEWYSSILSLDIDLEKVNSPVHNIPVNGRTGLTLDDHTFDPGYRFQPIETPCFNFFAPDIDEAYNFVKEKGAEIVKEIERIGDNFAYFTFKDIDGNVLMVCNC
jgi:predicted enzyme related to lactoylglutathione lyase